MLLVSIFFSVPPFLKFPTLQPLTFLKEYNIGKGLTEQLNNLPLQLQTPCSHSWKDEIVLDTLHDWHIFGVPSLSPTS